ncbi:MAG: phosphoglucosamine mutase [Phycisphaerales bacterium]|nr:MAG: phosphoglucosamine mutase [Phycisphaerales bacterium]
MSLMKGVSGIRGVVGQTLTEELAVNAGRAFAAYLGGRGKVVIGRDSRESGPLFQAAVMKGLTTGGIDVVDLGLATTPTVGVMVTELAADGGVVITASHNPIEYNGIKFLTRRGAAPDAATAQAILALLDDAPAQPPVEGRVGTITPRDGADEHHVARVLDTVELPAIREKRFRVFLDSVNGVGGHVGRALLDALGCHVQHQNAEPTGAFPRSPEPTQENLVAVSRKVGEAGVAVGFVQDPDADRLAIIDENGRYIGEEYTLALAARRIVSLNPGPIVVNLSTSRMVDDIAAARAGVRVVRTPVGEANVVSKMAQVDAVVGGEGNGGVIDPRVGAVRDSLVAMALTLDLMAAECRPLSAVVDEMPRYVMVKQKIACDRDRIAAVIDAVRRGFADQDCTDVDGIRVDWPDRWIHVRASNTEPILRVIAEAGELSEAEALVARVRSLLDGGG